MIHIKSPPRFSDPLPWYEVDASQLQRKASDMKTIKAFWRDQSGATAIEYGVLASLIAVVIIAGVTSVGTKLAATFSTIATAL